MVTKIASPIKNQILSDLQDLVADKVLGCVVVTDFSKDIFSMEIPAYPAALLGMSSIDSQEEDNQTNMRTYIFPIIVLQNAENLSSLVDMEDLRDAIMNKFDTDFDLDGNAIGAIRPSSSVAFSASTPDNNLVYFVVTIKARSLYQLNT